MPWRSPRIIVLPGVFFFFFLHEHLLVFNEYSIFVKPRIDFSESQVFSQFCGWIGRTMQILAAINLMGYTAVVLGYSKVIFLGEREDAFFCPSVYCVLAIYAVILCRRFPLSSIVLGVFHQMLLLFYFWSFLILSRVLHVKNILLWYLVDYKYFFDWFVLLKRGSSVLPRQGSHQALPHTIGHWKMPQ